jgi:hypothetical protein
MIGATKLNKNDIVRLKKLFAQDITDYQIAREFIPESGQTVSREHIRNIRIGKRWNDEERSFVMKEDLSDLLSVKTELNKMVFETQLGWLKTKSYEKWFLLTLLDDIEVNGPTTHLMDRKPLTCDILNFHNEFVAMYL